MNADAVYGWSLDVTQARKQENTKLVCTRTRHMIFGIKWGNITPPDPAPKQCLAK